MPVWFACCTTLCLKPSPWLSQKAIQHLGWLPSACHKRALGGFTLAELLICIAILGVIAVFTIPKIITTQQNQSYTAFVKESTSILTGAYTKANFDGIVTSSTKLTDLTPYMNYVQLKTIGTIDDIYRFATLSCSSTSPCIKLHNGSTLFFTSNAFGGTGASNALYYKIDPDGVVTDGTTNGPGKSLALFLYYSGKITDYGNINPGTTDSVVPFGYNPSPAYTPPWFSGW